MDSDASRIADAARLLAELASDLPKSSCHPPSDCEEAHVSQESVSWVIKARRDRGLYLPQDLFCDPAWDILLDLFRAEISYQRLAVSDLCIASGAPTTTGLRYLKLLAGRGMITRRPDHLDGRRTFVELAPEASGALRRYFVNVIQPRLEPGSRLAPGESRSAGSPSTRSEGSGAR